MNVTSVFASFSSFSATQAQYAQVSKTSTSNGDNGSNNSATKNSSTGSTVQLSYSKISVQKSELTYSTSVAISSDAQVVESESRTSAANNIVGFISGRLSADAAEGATTEELGSRLQAGLDGFVQGYQEAYKQLEQMSFLYSEVESAIEQTFSNVMSSFASLSEEYSIDVPELESLDEAQTVRRESFEPAELSTKAPDLAPLAPSADKSTDKDVEILSTVPPVATPAKDQETVQKPDTGSVQQIRSQPETEALQQISSKEDVVVNEEADNLKSLIEASAYDYQKEESRSFNFSLQTQDGDSVTIKAAYASSSLFDGESITYGASESDSPSGQLKVASGLYLDIQGDIDEDELIAIEEVLAQVKEVSDLFFAGDIESAFNSVVEMGFNSEEIAEFSLQLRYQMVETYTENPDVYGPPSAANGIVNAEGSDSGIQNEVNKLLLMSEQDENVNQLARFVQVLEQMRVNFDSLLSTAEAKESTEGEVIAASPELSEVTDVAEVTQVEEVTDAEEVADVEEVNGAPSASNVIIGELMTALSIRQESRQAS